MTFQDVGIAYDILKAINEMGFEKPMPIQFEVIPHILSSDKDIVALAQTGTGKTAAFGLPLIQKIDLKANTIQTLILSPTRELCIQIADDLVHFGKYIDKLSIVPVYGGASIDTQIRALKKGAHIVVATPGRLLDMINRKALNLQTVRSLVLDEADEMLTMGFLESIESILKYLPDTTSKYLFSATMPKAIASIAKKYMKNAVEITVGSKNSGADNIKHIAYTVQARDKYATLKRIADYFPDIYGIVFCRTRKETQDIADSLMKDGYNAEPLHGDLSQIQRDAVMNKFRNKSVRLLVATDVAARGIDVDNLSHIINYNLPDDTDQYNHRSGRTGRAGKSGVSIAIINMKEKHKIREIEKKIGKEFEWLKVPTGSDVCEKQLFHLIEKIEHIEIDENEIKPYLPLIYKKLGWLEKEDLIQRLVSVEFNRFLQYYKHSEDLNTFDKFEKGSKRNDKEKRRDGDFKKIFINIGKTDGFHPSFLIETLNKMTNGTKFKIGKIDIFKNFSIVDIESSKSDKVLTLLNGHKFDDRILVAKYDSEPNSSSKSKDKSKKRKKW